MTTMSLQLLVHVSLQFCVRLQQRRAVVNIRSVRSTSDVEQIVLQLSLELQCHLWTGSISTCQYFQYNNGFL